MSEHSTSTTSSLLITNATLILPGESVPHGAVAVVDGRIAEIGPAETLRSGGLPVVDAGGAYCLPGLVNLHDDEIETEVNPRVGANLPLRFARRNYVQRAVGAGVTTAFMAIAYADLAFTIANPRTLAAALAVGGEIERDRGMGGLDQHILPRFAIDRPEIVKDVILPLLDQQPVRALAFLGAGYSRFKDEEQVVERLRSIYPDPAGCAALQQRYFSGDITARDALLGRDPRDLAPEELVPYLLCLLHREQERMPFALSTHDDESAEKVSLMHAVGASICEMPVEIEAAERARELGMYVSVGAPNIARGGSTRGRLAASDLVARGLADIIVADYHAPSLLYALFEVVRLGATDLLGAVRLCSTNPAEAMGMSDRGQIQSGRRADLALVTIEDGVPVCRATFLEGRMRYSTLPLDARVPVGVA
ncbi:MAG: amidohydrolase family protein [Dehalococcoidia bacterium]|nr:amidohydrolase family protein [Dehalococcoidia bacterium]